MKFAVLAAAIALISPLLAAQDTPATPPPADGAAAKPPSKRAGKSEKPEKFIDANPALLYWQAFALMPELRQPQSKLMADVLEGRLPASDASVDTLLSNSRRGLDRFARAARGKQPCVWGTTIDEGPFAPMPHLTKMQQMCRLALVQAEAHYAAGDLEAAWQWTKHVHAAARHVGSDPLLITAIIQFGIEQQAIRMTAKYALRMDVDHGDDIVRAMKSMPPLHSVREALTGEHAMAEWTRLMVMGIQNSPESEQALLETAQAHLNAESEDPSSAKSAAAKQALVSVEEWKLLAAQGRALQARAEAASTKSWKEYQTDLQLIHTSLADASPTVKNTLPAFEGAMRKQFETRTLQAMLFAVLHPPADGHKDGEMKRFTDAFEEQPLIMNRSVEPWVVSMQGKVNGKPLTLEVGR
ncbi:MAG TPA: hypothetical protein VLE43_00285 [Candidatus Saccharimonadia bacterium]|nr:hypothetical protein [Candidatus Saccharimonadia bacterium]